MRFFLVLRRKSVLNFVEYFLSLWFTDMCDLQVHLYGTSLGGFLAQMFAQYRPRRVKSLLLSNTFVDNHAFQASMSWSSLWVTWYFVFLSCHYNGVFCFVLLQPDNFILISSRLPIFGSPALHWLNKYWSVYLDLILLTIRQMGWPSIILLFLCSLVAQDKLDSWVCFEKIHPIRDTWWTTGTCDCGFHRLCCEPGT